ncbi:hypothetical protein [Kitasatospora sp. MBT66]|uniref:hypothetical protein n=1 Tax=Kitasatospora sp. MBT66 TaxID=1444769 RepID=UPI001E3B7B16|nr:hypothetical protein [Kitasatospora sp. MBT66]
MEGHDAQPPTRKPAAKPDNWKPKVAPPVVTGTATVTIGADDSGAEAARSATDGAARAAGGGTAAKAGPLAVEIAPTAGKGESAHKVTVQVTEPAQGKAAGVNAPLIALSDAEPAATTEGRSASVTLDLKALQAAGWSDRAVLLALPGCALTTPERTECRTKTPVPARTDGKGKITADITLPPGKANAAASETGGAGKASLAAAEAPVAASAAVASGSAMVLAAAPAPNGALGNYAATPLSPSAAWSAGSNSGNFTYSYPIQVPPSLGGAAPGVALTYNSASVDGKTSATNAQPSWIGDGWEYEPGYIERTYKSCDKAGIAHSADQCWGGENATLVLGGRSGTIVRDDATGSWHLQNDDGSKIERLTGAPRTGRDLDYYAMEYWRITTTDGVQYYFGLNHLPGGDGTDPAANSVLTMPVYSPNAKDVCYNAATGSNSWCPMAWRWQLDHVVDSHGNLTSYGYATEVNKYSRGYVQGGGTGVPTGYERAGYLREIDYGQRLADQRAAKGTLNPAAKVLFGVEERCDPAKTSSCAESQRTTANQEAWPDVPIDQICTEGPCTNASPTFFTTKRLTEISTQVLVDSTYRTVDLWKLKQSLADPGDGTPRILQLDSVQRVPSNGQAAIDNLPPVAFKYDMMANRVDGIELQSGVREGKLFMRPRLKEITTETGGRVNVIYRTGECSRLEGRMPASEDSNTLACIPVKWYLPGQSSSDPVNDWFNKPVVETITEQDLGQLPRLRDRHHDHRQRRHRRGTPVPAEGHLPAWHGRRLPRQRHPAQRRGGQPARRSVRPRQRLAKRPGPRHRGVQPGQRAGPHGIGEHVEHGPGREPGQRDPQAGGRRAQQLRPPPRVAGHDALRSQAGERQLAARHDRHRERPGQRQPRPSDRRQGRRHRRHPRDLHQHQVREFHRQPADPDARFGAGHRPGPVRDRSHRLEHDHRQPHALRRQAARAVPYRR